MLIVAFEIIFAIFTVYGIYTFLHDLVDMLVAAVKKREFEKTKKENGKESDQDDDGEGREP